MNKSKVCIIANSLVGQGFSRSEAMRKAWATVKASGVETNVAGVTFENRQRILERLTHYQPEDITVTFEREADNQHDANAVKVLVSVKDSRTVCAGYIPKAVASLISPLMNARKAVKGIFESVTGKTRNYYNYGLLIKISV